MTPPLDLEALARLLARDEEIRIRHIRSIEAARRGVGSIEGGAELEDAEGDLLEAAREALPALLRIAKAAAALVETAGPRHHPGTGELFAYETEPGRFAKLRAALEGRGMNATPPIGTHRRYCYDDPAHEGDCQPVKRD